MISMTHQDNIVTERVVQLISKERARQKAYNFNDKVLTNGELISAAVSYADLAKKQIFTRDMSKLREIKRNKFNTSFVPPGGVDTGYIIKGAMVEKPTTWSFDDKMWAPGHPKSNLVRAAALIIAELERIERADKEVLAVPKSRPAKLNRATADNYGLFDDYPLGTTVSSVSTNTIFGSSPVIYQNVGGGLTAPNVATVKVMSGTI